MFPAPEQAEAASRSTKAAPLRAPYRRIRMRPPGRVRPGSASAVPNRALGPLCRVTDRGQHRAPNQSAARADEPPVREESPAGGRVGAQHARLRDELALDG